MGENKLNKLYSEEEEKINNLNKEEKKENKKELEMKDDSIDDSEKVYSNSTNSLQDDNDSEVSNDFTRRYGKVVWAKQGSYPYWPAFIYDPIDLPLNLLDLAKKHFGQKYVVYFYGSDNYAGISIKSIVPWNHIENDYRKGYPLKDYKSMSSSFKKLFLQAVNIADEDEAKDEDDRVAWKHVPSERLDSLVEEKKQQRKKSNDKPDDENDKIDNEQRKRKKKLKKSNSSKKRKKELTENEDEEEEEEMKKKEIQSIFKEEKSKKLKKKMKKKKIRNIDSLDEQEERQDKELSLTTSSSSVKGLRKLTKALKKYTTNDTKDDIIKGINIIHKIEKMTIDYEVLKASGLAELVRFLRKHKNPEIAQQASRLRKYLMEQVGIKKNLTSEPSPTSLGTIETVISKPLDEFKHNTNQELDSDEKEIKIKKDVNMKKEESQGNNINRTFTEEKVEEKENDVNLSLKLGINKKLNKPEDGKTLELKKEISNKKETNKEVKAILTLAKDRRKRACQMIELVLQACIRDSDKLRSISIEMECQVFNRFSNDQSQYQSQIRMLVFELRKNSQLLDEVLKGQRSLTELACVSHADFS